MQEAFSEETSTSSPKTAPKLRTFDIVQHLRGTTKAEKPRKHVIRGVQNLIATELQKGALRMVADYPEGFVPRAGQFEQIEQEMHSLRSKRRYIEVILSMPLLGGVSPGEKVDFKSEIAPYRGLSYHKYYLQPFHSVPGGWLSPIAATGNEAAMRALFRKSNRAGAEGLREVVANAVPTDAKLVYDFGATCGAQGALFAQRLAYDAKVVCIDPSPFGLIVGKKKFRDPRIEWVHGFAEDLDLPEGQADVVNFLFVLHETPDHIKRKLLAKALHVLKPGGMVMVHEPPSWDLEHRSAGFFEPYRHQWIGWECDKEMRELGFSDARRADIVDPDYMVTYVAHKPR